MPTYPPITWQGIFFGSVDYIVMGSVLQEVATTNLAKEASLGAGFPVTTPAHTIAMACLSSNQAVATATNLIKTGACDTVMAAGVELMSDVCIRYSRRMRQIILKLLRTKSWRERAALHVKMAAPSTWIPDVPDLVEFSTGEHLGHAADRLAATFAISREEQDAYAMESHQRAWTALDDGCLTDILPYQVPESDGKVISTDNGLRWSTEAELAEIEPFFMKPHGTVTPANASSLADGASGCLLMSEEKARLLGYIPKAYIRHYNFSAQDPRNQLLLGEAHAIPRVLSAANMTLADVDVFELQETFAGQLLATLKALDSTWFAQNCLGMHSKVGRLPLEKLNQWGGSIAFGHPFSASGIRILVTLANRLIREGGQFGLLANCSSGGQGHAMIIERNPDFTEGLPHNRQ